MTLKLADNLKLPIDAATQTFAFIARKGAGKTYTAGKLVELLLDAGVQVVVLDTVGNWYGLRLSADGKGKGFDVPVLGGLRGDIPLEAAGGALIADIVVDTGRSVVLDVSQWSKADRQRFATAFGERLWLRKKGEKHPAPLHLVIEESQLIVPQDVRGDTAKMVGVFEEIIRLGRNYGIGVSMITQRPQSVNKEVLNQTECLLVGQVNGAQERDALKKWITHQGMDVHLVDELPGLKIGTFYVWSPQWLNILEKVHILPKKTLDASATPKVGDKRVRRELKPLDLADLQEQLKSTIEKAKLDDPKLLRAEVSRLNAQVLRLNQEIDRKPAGKEKRVEVPVLKDGQLDKLHHLSAMLAERAQNLVTPLQKVADQLTSASKEIADAVRQTAVHASRLHGGRADAGTSRPLAGPGVPQRNMVPPPRRDVGVRGRVDTGGAAEGNGQLPAGEKATLIAAAQYPDGLTREQASILTGYKRSTRDAYISRLQAKGYLQPGGGTIIATVEGIDALGLDYEPLPTGEALQRYWLERLPAGEKAVLEVAINHYPNAVTREDVDNATGFKRSTRDAYISRLMARQLLGRGGGAITASSVLFEEA